MSDRTEVERAGRAWDTASRALDRAEAREREAVEAYIAAKVRKVFDDAPFDDEPLTAEELRQVEESERAIAAGEPTLPLAELEDELGCLGQETSGAGSARTGLSGAGSSVMWTQPSLSQRRSTCRFGIAFVGLRGCGYERDPQSPGATKWVIPAKSAVKRWKLTTTGCAFAPTS